MTTKPTRRSTGDHKALLLDLLRADTEEAAITILDSAGYWDNPAAWRLLSDREDNQAVVGAQASVAEAALVEKLTNSIDAVLMRKCLEAGIDPTGPDAPTSVRDAVRRFFEINPTASFGGSISAWDDSQILPVARVVGSVALTGSPAGRVRRAPNYPSITILDYGEGQAPERQPHTLLKIGGSLKRTVPFQHGKFAMGGTAALGFSGEHGLQLILSKRAPALAQREGVSDDWGFTIVRKNWQPPEKMSAYRYLAPSGADTKPGEGELLHFPAESLPIAPRGTKPYEGMVESGTLIKLYQYRTTFRSLFGMKSGLRHQLDAWLPEIPLPMRLHDCRFPEYEDRSVEWNLVGLVRTLRRVESDLTETGTLTVSGQTMTYQLVCLKQGNADTYRGTHGVVFAINGQSHGMLHSRFFETKAVGLGNLKDDLVLVVDCSEIDVPHMEELFSNSRDHLRESGFRRDIEEEITDLLRRHPDLERISRERRERRLEERLADQKPFEEVLEQVMKRSSVLNDLFLRGLRLSNQRLLVPQPTTEKFEGKPHPTFFRFRGHPAGFELARICHLGQRLRLDFETDVENSYFRRSALPGNLAVRLSLNDLSVSSDQYTHTTGIHQGAVHVYLQLPPAAEVKDLLRVEVVVTDDQLLEPFTNVAAVTVEAEQIQTPTKGGRTARPISPGTGPVRPQPAGFQFPLITPVEAEDWETKKGSWGGKAMDRFSALRISNLGGTPPQYEFFVNVDNDYFRKEVSTRRAPAEVLRAQWINGLTFVALGALRGSETSESESESEPPMNISDEQFIARLTDGVAPILLPMIEGLAGLDPDEN